MCDARSMARLSQKLMPAVLPILPAAMWIHALSTAVGFGTNIAIIAMIVNKRTAVTRPLG